MPEDKHCHAEICRSEVSNITCHKCILVGALNEKYLIQMLGVNNFKIG